MITPDTKELIKPGTLQDFCDAYAQAVEAVDAAFLAMANAKARMERIIERFNILPQNLYDFSLEDEAKSPRQEARSIMQRSAWGEILRMTGVTDVMIQRKRDELVNAIDKGEVPPITFENVMALLNGLRGDVGKIVNESILEAARLLRPTDGEYKTNGGGWQLGRRAILRYGVSYSYGSFNLNYGRDAHISVIDNAFHLLDGKGVPQRPHRLDDLIRAAINRKEQRCENDYFKCKWHKTGSLHIEFKRLDLVDELNGRAADHHSLRGAAQPPAAMQRITDAI